MAMKRQCPSVECGNRLQWALYIIICIFLFPLSGFAQNVSPSQFVLPICQWKDPRIHASATAKEQANSAYDAFRDRRYRDAIQGFSSAYQTHPFCHFLAPLIAAYIRHGSCSAATDSMHALEQTDGEFSADRELIVQEWERACPQTPGPPAAPTDFTQPTAPMPRQDATVAPSSAPVPMPSVPKESLPVPQAASARSSAVSERRPWYRKAWPWLTAAGVAVTAAGIGIGIGLGAGQGQGTGIPFSSLYDGPQAVPLARSVH